jgi:hypothetical protein
MSWKEKCLEAVQKTIQKYETFEDILDREDIIEDPQYCWFCKLYMNKNVNCWGCPSSSVDGGTGCVFSPTYRQVVESIYTNNSIDINDLKGIMAIKERIRYWQERLPILESMPEKCFNPESKYFFDIDNILEKK